MGEFSGGQGVSAMAVAGPAVSHINLPSKYSMSVAAVRTQGYCLECAFLLFLRIFLDSQR